MFARIDHIGIVAHNWDEAQHVLLDLLGLTVEQPRTPLPDGIHFAPENTRNYFIMVGDGPTRIEVLIPMDPNNGTGRFLAARGPGLHHIGYACADVAAEARRLRENGLRQIELKVADPSQSMGAAFFHPKDCGGILTELVPLRR